MAYTVRRTVAPAAPAVSTSDAKTWLRIDGNADDALVANLVEAATEMVERYVRRALVTQTLELVLDDFPRDPVALSFYGGYNLRRPALSAERLALLLPYAAPLGSVASVIYDDEDGAAVTLDAADYRVDAKSEPARIVPSLALGAWPDTVAEGGTVRVTYTAGYGSTAADVPALLRQAVLAVVQRLYDRECVGDCAEAAAGALARPFRVMVP